MSEKLCGRLKIVYLVIAISLCLSLPFVPKTAYAENEPSEYNFSIMAERRDKHNKGRSIIHTYYLYFDFDNEIAVLYDSQFHHYNSTKGNTDEYSVYKLQQGTDDMYSLTGVDGKEYFWRFKLKRDSSFFGLITKIWITDYDTKGTKTGEWHSTEVNEQPISRLYNIGFYKKYPNPDKVKSAVQDK